MIKAVILDFDDTLCMTAESNYRMLSESLRLMKLTPLSYEENKKTVGDPLKVTMKKYYPNLELEELMKHLTKIRAENLDKGLIENIDDKNLEALDKLAGQGKKLMVLTSRRMEGLLHVMDPRHHLGSRIANFYHLANNPFHKPDPRTFAVIEKEHKLKPAECVYVGDTLNDAAAAKGAGLHFVANLESGILTKSDFADHEVDEFIDKFPDVVDAVASLERKLNKDAS